MNDDAIINYTPLILIVEDDDGLNFLIREGLEDTGFSSEGLLNGKDALARIMENPDVLLVLDYTLPDMTAIQFFEELDKRELIVPFIIMTGHAEVQTSVEMMKLGARDYLLKDTTFLDLIPAVVTRVVDELRIEKKLLNATESLRLSEERYKSVFDRSLDGIFLMDFEGNFVDANKATLDLLGYTREEIQKVNISSLVSRNKLDELYYGLLYLRDIEKQKELQISEIRKKNGEHVWIEVRSSIIYKNGKPSLIQGNARNITSRLETEKKLKESEEKYRSLYNNALVGMATVQINDNRLLSVNETIYKMFGYSSSEELISEVNIDGLFADSSEKEKFLSLLESGEIRNFEAKLLKKDRTVIWCEISAKKHIDEKKFDIIIADISRRKDVEEQVHHLTFYDKLTQLPNKELFKKHIEAEILKSDKRDKNNVFAVMCLGMNNFKRINNIYGTNTGNSLLKEIGSRLEKSIFETDTVSRYDGDKFMILFSNIQNRDDAGDIVRKIVSLLQEPFKVEEYRLTVSAGIGICLFPSDGDNSDLLLENSEAAMYIAKKQGLDMHFFDAQLNNDMIKRFQFEKELRTAINNKEFIQHYQPKVNQQGEIIGMESLVRWCSPRRGLVHPGEFITLAEENKMILDIGDIVLYKSCSQNKKWQRMGYKPLRISVNLSAHQFHKTNIVGSIKKIIGHTDLNPEYLELEITESGIMADEKDSIQKLKEIHEMGVSISIDDFGTGYSSLSKLKDYPIDTLKIDRAFIKDLPINRKSATIATTIIDLAHNLGFKVVAEGVETKEQFSFLVSMKCDQFQGFYFSKPLPSDEFEKKLIKN